jgi:hypothetical protein
MWGYAWRNVLENLQERDHSGETDTDGRLMLKWILGKYVRVWNGISWLKLESCGRFLCEHGNYISVLIKEREFLDKLNDCKLFMKGRIPCT